MEKLRGDTDGRLAALKGSGALDEYEARRKIAALEKPDDRAAVVALGEKEEAVGQRGVALEIYEHVVSRWPADPKAAEAGYRAGRILLSQKRWRDAILALGRVAEGHPKSEQAPEAMVGVGEAMTRAGDGRGREGDPPQVLDKYPKAPAARRAREALNSLDRGRAQEAGAALIPARAH